MPKVKFTPQNLAFDAEPNTKLLATANRNKVPLRFGCASCRCGTCGILLTEGAPSLSAMRDDEKALLKRMALPLDGTVRLACQARIGTADVTVDLDFQNKYSPDDGDETLEDA